MISKRTSGWKLHDWLFFIFFAILLATIFTATVHTFFPTSSVGIGLHNAGQAVGHALQYIASGFNLVASCFLQL